MTEDLTARATALLAQLDQRLKVGAGLSLATDPPQRYFTDAQGLLRECRNLLAALATWTPPEHENPEAWLVTYSFHDIPQRLIFASVDAAASFVAEDMTRCDQYVIIPLYARLPAGPTP